LDVLIRMKATSVFGIWRMERLGKGMAVVEQCFTVSGL